jgi:hypothetical protein
MLRIVEDTMKTIAVALGITLSVAAATSRPTIAQSADAAAILARARQALGGEAMLSGIRSLRLDGLWWINGMASCYGPRLVVFELPARFVQHDALPEPDGEGAECGNTPPTTFRRGFAGDEVIHEARGASGDAPSGDPLDEKHRSVQYLLPLFASSFASYPLSFTYTGQQSIAGRASDVIDALGPDGFVFRLFIDLKTHLPALLTWMATTPRFGIDPASGLPKAEARQPVAYRMSIGDYKRTNGVNWPRRFRVQVNTRVVDEFWRVAYTINPAIHSNMFAITKDITVTMSTPTTKVSGRVAVPASASPLNYFVVMFSADRSSWVSGSRVVRSEQPGADGTCEFRDLPAGKYRLAVVTDLPPGDQIDAAYLATLTPASLAITVRKGPTTFQLRLGGASQ